MSATIVLSEPPSANRYWRNYRGVTVLSDKAREYKKEVRLRALAARVESVPLEDVCAVHLRWFRSRKAGDLDNRIKIVLDALQGTAYVYDSQVVEVHAYRHDDKKNPRLEVSVFIVPQR